MVRGTKGIGALLAFGAVAALGACKKSDSGAADSSAAAATAGGTTTTTTTDSSANVQATGATSNPASTKAMTDPEIFAMLTAANQGEIDAGKMASSKATSADVKAFARQMVTDHSKMLADGQALAKRLNVTPMPAAGDSINSANKAMASALTSAAKGAAFDSAYVNGQVTGHENTLDMIKRAEDQAQNADLKNMLKSAEPAVQKHLDRIKDIQGKMK